MRFIATADLDFGSIHLAAGGDYTLLGADIGKLNTVLTAAVCKPLLAAGQIFNVTPGAVAFVANWKTAGTAKAYIYEPTSDTWYEFIENEDAESTETAANNALLGSSRSGGELEGMKKLEVLEKPEELTELEILEKSEDAEPGELTEAEELTEPEDDAEPEELTEPTEPTEGEKDAER